MRLVLLVAVFVLGWGLRDDSSTSAAVMAGGALNQLDSAAPLTEPAHCRRWLPHRHAGGKPHGFGFGCLLKRPKPKRPVVRK
jgi:hypothetical protein